jgi:hypothetical protein
MLGEDVNGDFRAFEIDLVELDRLFMKRALGRGQGAITHFAKALIDSLVAERKLIDKPTEPRKSW